MAKRVAILAALAIGSMVGVGPAAASGVSPPTVVASFSPNPVTFASSQQSTYTITLTNPNGSATLTGVSVSDTLPADLQFLGGTSVTQTCAGTEASDTTTLSESGLTLAPNASCTFSGVVTAGDAGSYTTVTGQVSANESGAGLTASATLNMMAPPSISANFSPPTINTGGSNTTTLTVTITNPNLGAAVDLVAFEGSFLPSGLAYASPSNLQASGCGGGLAFTSPILALTSGTIAPGGTCTVSATVQASAAGSYTFQAGQVSSDSGAGGNGNTADPATLTVLSPPSIAAAFSPATVAEGVTSTLTVTVTNDNAVTLTGVSFTDTLPSGLVAVAATGAFSNGCPNAPSFGVGPGLAFSVGAGSLSSGVTCTIHVGVNAAAAGGYTDTTGVVTSIEGGNAASVSAPLTVLAPPSISASFSPSTVTIGTGGSSGSTLSFTIANTNASTALTGVAFSQTLPSGLAVAAIPAVTNSCGGTPSAVAGSGSISLAGGSLAGASSCTVAVAVQASSVQTFNLTSGAVASTNGGTGTTASASLIANRATPIVGSVSPNAGPLAGGTSVIITGNNFTAASAVQFGATAATGFVVISDTNISATAPAGSTGAVDITVANTTGTSAIAVADAYTYASGPVVTAISPAGGPLGGGNGVTITGSNLTGATGVKFGTVAAVSFTADSATRVTAIAPAGAAGSVDVTVTTPGGTSAAVPTDLYTYGTSVVTLSASANPLHFGDPVTLTAAVGSTSGQPSGTVGFWDGSTLLATGTLANHLTSFTTSALTVGSHSLVARYAGDGEFSAGASSSLTLTVDTTSIPTAGQVYAYQTTLGTTGTAQADNSHLAAPSAVALDRSHGHVLVADSGNHRVQIFDAASLAVIGTIGVPGAAGSDNAHLDQPGGVGFDPATDRIFVADTLNQRVQIFDGASFAYLSTLAVTLDLPTSVFVNTMSRQLYIADSGDHRVLVLDAGSFASVATLGVAGVAGADNAHLNQPMDAELDPSTNQILVADSANHRVQIFDAASFAYVSTLGDATADPADNLAFSRPVGAEFDPVSNLVLVADAGAENRVQAFDAMTYRYVLTLGTTGSSGASSSQFATPGGIAVDPDHARLYVADQQNDRVQSFSIAPVTSFAATLPGSRSVRLGTPATIFASFDNNSTAMLSDCRVALPVTAPSGLTLDYQTTNPATNALIGTPDKPAVIPGKSIQTFLVTLQAADPLTAAGQALDFDCEGAAPAAVILGVDTVDLTIAAGPVPDIIALAATPSDNGILIVPSGGAAAFAVASSNAGAGAQIIAAVDTGTATLPLGVTLCQSDPSSGQCLATPAGTVTFNDAAGASPTFSVFVQVTGTIPLDPAASRLFVRFKDASGALRGSTSVAVQTR